MPKISAPTVAEHRAAQRAALVEAGGRILVEDGMAGITARTVTERAGLARSSFYDYFPSKDDLLVAIAIDVFAAWDAEIEQALAEVEAGLPKLRALVDATMAMTADGRHDLAGALREADLHPSRYEDLMVMHDALLRPLVQVLADAGEAEPERSAMLVQGVLGAGIQLVTHGVDHRQVAADVYRVLTQGVFG
ncbi:AcrR family transcriptional regulator [Agromyces flavus]|uniref:AcrR family transcriptional regulator n=1 Tax=Agromyces flavus TaxID=589382 RepID=A0A1H1Y569_9MICO|nr:TetR/AcrR family transcriptional regulator [Agromyces flavus]MCP2366585.1 AcrR family transcriptional regulator [Agromyces flavus]GGI44970.1 TetR family transcriptional regulator [Agromyces flavus]SDT16525.1 DNA-binding transcriptional regulator, AcrR family [Agromyces flavus]